MLSKEDTHKLVKYHVVVLCNSQASFDFCLITTPQDTVHVKIIASNSISEVGL